MHAGRGFGHNVQQINLRLMEVSAVLTVNIDEHVLSGALPQVAQTGHTVQCSSMIRSGSMNGEALLDIKGDVRPVHCHLHRWKLAVQSHFRLR